MATKRQKTNREKVIECLSTLSKSIFNTDALGVSANDIAKQIDIQRSTVSLYLNELVRNGDAIKVNTRPVYFLDEKIYQANKSEFDQVTQYIQRNDNDVIQDPFGELVGSEGSLKDVVDQIKSAVIYPPRGLPTLLVGESGVGKSFIAQLAYQFARQKNWLLVNGWF